MNEELTTSTALVESTALREAQARAAKLSLTGDVGTRVLRQIITVFGPSPEDILSAVTWLGEMKPKNITEAMLYSQMICVHELAMKFLGRISSPNHVSAEMEQRLTKQASWLMRVFTEQQQAVRCCKGKAGQQMVTVKHMYVGNGGQALVGVVKKR